MVHRNPAAGQLLDDRYRIGELVGRGGMASVYRAEDEKLGRIVAIKIFADESDSHTHGDRKRSEVRVLASLNHPALVTVFDAKLDAEPSPYLVMEFVDGPALNLRLAEGPIGSADVAAMAKDLSEALAVVHAAGIVHRDIKPSNVLLTGPSEGRPFRAKLADFGIAQLADGTRLTMPGTMMGTVGYLPPEQLGDSTPAPPADIYSLGLVLLECLTGERAFPGTAAESMSARLVSDPTVPESVPEAFREMLSAMTARDPENRPTAARVFKLAARAERQLGDDDSTGVFATVPMHAAEVSADDLATAPMHNNDSADAPTVAFAQPAPRSRSRQLVGIVAVSVVVAVLVIWGGSQLAATLADSSQPPAAPSEAPQLPALDEPLSSHFEQLLESVNQ